MTAPALQDRFQTLVEHHKKILYKVCNSYCRNRDDREDLAQEIIIQLWRSFERFDERCRFSTWMYRIAVNEARNQKRWFSRHKGREVTLEPEDSQGQGYRDWLEDDGPSPLQIALDRETRDCIEAALTQVNPSFRAALVLREMEGLSYEQVAEILQISLGTVKSKILRGREALRKHLAADFDRRSPSGSVCRRALDLAR